MHPLLPKQPLLSHRLHPQLDTIDDHEIKEIEREIEERKKAEEVRRRGEVARELRVLDKEIKRRSDGRREERQSAAAALRSQFAGLDIEDGDEGSSSSSLRE
ncbi:hypothetical protein E4T52_16430 [Aureobasidium sp. EXF-3400]|nr:hypothetical protein E4T51_14826 [Aureobasidium sp. EXF-12344]KAI4768480.1 hypothetical protein E4T52_16430 [Aureobasidium sp. EXF-3400]